jgi:ABC-type multidrug transport system ATPase subunit
MMENAIVVQDLRKRFGEVTASTGSTLRSSGERCSGCWGRTAPARPPRFGCWPRCFDPTAAVVLGCDVVREADAVRRRIGLAGQNAAVDPNLTGRENLRMVGMLGQMQRADVMPRADELLDRFGLSDAANRPLRTSSGGMRWRLDVAASLMPRPPVLFLDEPTTGLDLPSREELWDMIRELVEDGTTVLLTTQYLEEADRLANRIAVVDRRQGHRQRQPGVA